MAVGRWAIADFNFEYRVNFELWLFGNWKFNLKTFDNYR